MKNRSRFLTVYGTLYSSWTPLVAQTVKTLPARQETWVRFLPWEILWGREWHTSQSIKDITQSH